MRQILVVLLASQAAAFTISTFTKPSARFLVSSRTVVRSSAEVSQEDEASQKRLRKLKKGELFLLRYTPVPTNLFEVSIIVLGLYANSRFEAHCRASFARLLDLEDRSASEVAQRTQRAPRDGGVPRIARGCRRIAG